MSTIIWSTNGNKNKKKFLMEFHSMMRVNLFSPICKALSALDQQSIYHNCGNNFYVQDTTTCTQHFSIINFIIPCESVMTIPGALPNGKSVIL